MSDCGELICVGSVAEGDDGGLIFVGGGLVCRCGRAWVPAISIAGVSGSVC